MPEYNLQVSKNEWDSITPIKRLKILEDFFKQLLVDSNFEEYGVQRFKLEEILDEATNLNPENLQVYLDSVYTTKDVVVGRDFEALTAQALQFELRLKKRSEIQE